MDFKTLAEIAQKKQKTVEVFFSRNKLSIKNLGDVRIYLQRLFTQKRWRNSDYRADHLQKYHFSKMDEKIPFGIEKQFSKVAFLDRNPATLTKYEFIQQVVRYGVYEDLNALKKNFKQCEIRSVYSTKLAMIRDFSRPVRLKKGQAKRPRKSKKGYRKISRG